MNGSDFVAGACDLIRVKGSSLLTSVQAMTQSPLAGSVPSASRQRGGTDSPRLTWRTTARKHDGVEQKSQG